MDRCDCLGKLCRKIFAQSDAFALPLAAVTLPVDVPGPCIKGRKQVEGAIAPLFMRALVGAPRVGWFRGVHPRAGLQGRLCIEAEDHLSGPEAPGGERDDHLKLGIERGLAGVFGG
jgi:hypothetical protein